jgi:hypothetical protein
MYSEAVLVIPHRGVVIPSGAASAGTDASIVGAQAGLPKRLGSILESQAWQDNFPSIA